MNSEFLSEMVSSSDQKKQMKDMLENVDSKTLRSIIMETACTECKKCSGFLTPPIAYIEHFGNVCGNCSETYRKKILNVNLNTILKDCIVPCVFTNNGCTEKIPFSSLDGHQKICEHRNYRCPLNCNVFQHAGSLLTHVQLKHSKKLLNLSDDTVPMDLEIVFNHDEFNYAYIIKNSLFFNKIKYNHSRTHLYCGILYAGNENKDFTYQITQVGSLILPYELKGNVLRNLSYWNDFNNNDCLSIACDFIKEVPPQAIKIKIIIDEKIKKLEVNNPTLKVLECPICFHCLIPPIYQCIAGHTICNQCRSKVTICPTCKNEFGDTRNYSLEALSESLNLVNVQEN